MSQYRNYPVRVHKGKVQVLAEHWRAASEGECWQCGTKFYYPLQGRADMGRFCGEACLGKYRSKIYDRKRKSKHCEVCGQMFKVQPSKAHRYHSCGRRTCNLEVKRRSGINRWKKYHETHPQAIPVTYDENYKRFRDEQGRFVKEVR